MDLIWDLIQVWCCGERVPQLSRALLPLCPEDSQMQMGRMEAETLGSLP